MLSIVPLGDMILWQLVTVSLVYQIRDTKLWPFPDAKLHQLHLFRNSKGLKMGPHDPYHGPLRCYCLEVTGNGNSRMTGVKSYYCSVLNQSSSCMVYTSFCEIWSTFHL